MAKKRKRKNRPLLKKKSDHLAQGVRLYNLLPVKTPSIQPCIPISSLEFLDEAVSQICFNGNRIALFLKVCGKVGFNSPRFEFRVLSILDCFRRDFLKITRFVQSVDEKKIRMRLNKPPICPGCKKTMMVRDLSYLPYFKNRLEWQSHWICFECIKEFYSNTSIDDFGFPLEPINLSD